MSLGASKHFTDAELAAEYHAENSEMAPVNYDREAKSWESISRILHRFSTHEHVAPAPCRHMYSMTLSNGDRVCRCGDVKAVGGEKK